MKKFYAFVVFVLAAIQVQAQWSTSGSDIYNTNGGGVGIGTTAPAAKLEVQNGAPLYSNGDNVLMKRISNLGANTNYFQSNLWLRRATTESGWLGVNLHDGISIDGSFLSPGSNTRTWWERSPFHDVQSWGTGDWTYMSLVGPEGYVDPGLMVYGGVGAYEFDEYSDARLKEHPQSISNGMDVIKQLMPKEYTFRKNATMKLPQGKRSGLYAQELQKVLPHLVSQSKDGYLKVHYNGLIPYMISAMQEQQKTIERQEVLLQSLLNDTKAAVANATDHDLTKPRLFQSSPNPSNGSTSIKYYLPNGSTGAAIHIYNLAGEQLSKYENLGSGENTLLINSGTMKPGMYIYSLIGAGQVWDSKKMVLIE